MVDENGGQFEIQRIDGNRDQFGIEGRSKQRLDLNTIFIITDLSLSLRIVNLYGSESPATWYTVFRSGNSAHNRNFLRRYVSHSYPFPLPEDITTQRRRRATTTIEGEPTLITENDRIRITVGDNLTCIELGAEYKGKCNGPLGAGLSYRCTIIIFVYYLRVFTQSFQFHMSCSQ